MVNLLTYCFGTTTTSSISLHRLMINIIVYFNRHPVAASTAVTTSFLLRSATPLGVLLSIISFLFRASRSDRFYLLRHGKPA
uniref:Uncharacterized protein n=1 Tax=Kalanchoe fedtschenkoi TaxID=63787 RepID=A0A7N1A256_KALFE